VHKANEALHAIFDNGLKYSRATEGVASQPSRFANIKVFIWASNETAIAILILDAVVAIRR